MILIILCIAGKCYVSNHVGNPEVIKLAFLPLRRPEYRPASRREHLQAANYSSEKLTIVETKHPLILKSFDATLISYQSLGNLNPLGVAGQCSVSMNDMWMS